MLHVTMSTNQLKLLCEIDLGTHERYKNSLFALVTPADTAHFLIVHFHKVRGFNHLFNTFFVPSRHVTLVHVTDCREKIGQPVVFPYNSSHHHHMTKLWFQIVQMAESCLKFPSLDLRLPTWKHQLVGRELLPVGLHVPRNHIPRFASSMQSSGE